MDITLCIITALLFLAASISADERELYRDIFDGYVKKVRPRRDSTDTVEVTVNVELNGLKEIAETSQVQVANAIIEAEWYDDFLIWDPDEYDNITEIVVPPTKIWLPDFGIQNSLDDFYLDGIFQYFRVHVGYTGRIIWSFGGLLETSCAISVSTYPFDDQNCSIVIRNWAYSKEAVTLVNNSACVRLDNYQDNGVWELLGTSVVLRDIEFQIQPGALFPQLEFVMMWHRKPRYYLINLMLPCVFLLMIAFLVFWLPMESQEKISLSVNVLLAFTVLQIFIASSTPEVSELPVISIFVAIAMSLSAISVITTIIVLHFYHKTSNCDAPYLVRLVFFKILARIFFVPVSDRQKTKPIASNDRADDKNKNMEKDKEKEVDEGYDEHETRFRDGSRDIQIASRVQTTSGGDDDDVFDRIEMCIRSIAGQRGQADFTSESLAELSREMDEVIEQLMLKASRMADEENDWQTLAKVIDRSMFWVVFAVLMISVTWMCLFI